MFYDVWPLPLSSGAIRDSTISPGVSGLDFADDSRAFAVTDFDNDGNLDFILKSRLAPQVRVLQNNCGVGKPVIVFDCEATQSNRDAIGARLKWTAGSSGSARAADIFPSTASNCISARHPTSA